jgi:polysaccharide deacetylase family protein (PEP-CTERM system associated)
MRSAVTNVLSFDVEHWYSATLLRDAVTDPVERIDESVGIVLDLLADHDVTATFFVVGEIAREQPDLVARIAAEGHEIGSHGHTHRPLFELTREQFAAELDRSSVAIRDATGTPPVGFRAPNFSVTPRTQWAIAVLDRAGFLYDSSVFPVRTPMYGVAGVPVQPSLLDPNAPFENRSENGTLVELPLAVFHPRFRLPVAGGFYARLLPTWLLKRGIHTLNARGLPATIYFHPWEFNSAVATTAVPAHKRFVSFHGNERLKAKLETLLDTFVFTTANTIARKYTDHPDPVDRQDIPKTEFRIGGER